MILKFNITIREVFPEADYDETCVCFDADVDHGGTITSLKDIRGCVAGFRQDFESDPQPDVRPAFPDDFMRIQVGVPDVDDDCIFHEIIYDATRIALKRWARAKTADPNVQLPFTASVDYETEQL